MFFCTASLMCNKQAPVLKTMPMELPAVDSMNYAQCVIRYKNSLHDKNLALIFKVRVIFFEDAFSDYILQDQVAKADTIIDNLNVSFAEQGISFVIDEVDTNLESTNINQFLAHFEEYEKVGTLTIIVYPKTSDSAYNGIASGVPGIVMGVVEDKIATSTVPHEMGHVLGAYHIFEKDDTDGKNATTGDKICDTGSFNLMDNRTRDCGYIGKPKYSEEDLKVFIPNYMNYNAEDIDCRDRFTPVQMLSIRWHIENFPTLYEALYY
jgi:hypothetical protein